MNIWAGLSNFGKLQGLNYSDIVPIRMQRVWTTGDATAVTRPCMRYDFGNYEGWLDGDVWHCWRILCTEDRNGSVVQTLEKMPMDFCPFEAYSIQELHVAGNIDSPNVIQARSTGHLIFDRC